MKIKSIESDSMELSLVSRWPSGELGLQGFDLKGKTGMEQHFCENFQRNFNRKRTSMEIKNNVLVFSDIDTEEKYSFNLDSSQSKKLNEILSGKISQNTATKLFSSSYAVREN